MSDAGPDVTDSVTSVSTSVVPDVATDGVQSHVEPNVIAFRSERG